LDGLIAGYHHAAEAFAGGGHGVPPL